MMARYRKKPVVVDAVQWDGKERPDVEWWRNARVPMLHDAIHNRYMSISVGDWIVRDPNSGDVWPVLPDVFAATYEPAE